MAPPRAARAPRHVGDLGLPELALAVPLFVLVAASGLFLFNNLLRLFAQFSSASGVKGNPVLVALQPYLALLKPAMQTLFGTTAFKVGLQELLLAAILIVLTGIWRSVHVQTQVLEKERKEE